jgi:hypothetical protein
MQTHMTYKALDTALNEGLAVTEISFICIQFLILFSGLLVAEELLVSDSFINWWNYWSCFITSGSLV